MSEEFKWDDGKDEVIAALHARAEAAEKERDELLANHKDGEGVAVYRRQWVRALDERDAARARAEAAEKDCANILQLLDETARACDAVESRAEAAEADREAYAQNRIDLALNGQRQAYREVCEKLEAAEALCRELEAEPINEDCGSGCAACAGCFNYLSRTLQADIDALQAKLATARREALEEAAKTIELEWDHEIRVRGLPDAIRALADTKGDGK